MAQIQDSNISKALPKGGAFFLMLLPIVAERAKRFDGGQVCESLRGFRYETEIQASKPSRLQRNARSVSAEDLPV